MAENEESQNPVIDEFIKDYENWGIAVYTELTEATKKILAKSLCDLQVKHELYDRGNQGAKQGRVKSVESTKQTILRRQDYRINVTNAGPYTDKQQITAEMHDLAGIRIALYYPNQLDEVEEMLGNRFIIKKKVYWPDPNPSPSTSQANGGKPKSVFPGYIARHFHAELAERDTRESTVIRGKVIEIQLTSLLMHTWSKVYHELAYKPQKNWSDDDKIRDQLNVLNGSIVTSDEILRALGVEISKNNEPFETKESFLSYLRKKEKELASNEPNLPFMAPPGARACRYNSVNSDAPPPRTPNPRNLRRNKEESNIEGDLPILYKSLCQHKQNTPSRVDLIIRDMTTGTLSTSQSFSSSTNRLRTFSNASLISSSGLLSYRKLVVGLADSQFIMTEYQKYQIPLMNDQLNGELFHDIKIVRFKALVICSALALSNDWEGIWYHVKAYTRRHLMIVCFQQILSSDGQGIECTIIQPLNNFLNYMIDCEDSHWKFNLACARIGWQMPTFGAGQSSQYYENIQQLLTSVDRDANYRFSPDDRADDIQMKFKGLNAIRGFINCRYSIPPPCFTGSKANDICASAEEETVSRPQSMRLKYREAQATRHPSIPRSEMMQTQKVQERMVEEQFPKKGAKGQGPRQIQMMVEIEEPVLRGRVDSNTQERQNEARRRHYQHLPPMQDIDAARYQQAREQGSKMVEGWGGSQRPSSGQYRSENRFMPMEEQEYERKEKEKGFYQQPLSGQYRSDKRRGRMEEQEYKEEGEEKYFSQRPLRGQYRDDNRRGQMEEQEYEEQGKGKDIYSRPRPLSAHGSAERWNTKEGEENNQRYQRSASAEGDRSFGNWQRYFSQVRVRAGGRTNIKSGRENEERRRF